MHFYLQYEEFFSTITEVKGYVKKCENTWASILAKILNLNVMNRDGFTMPAGYTPDRYNICGYINNRVY